MSLKAETKASQSRGILTYRTIALRWFGIVAPLVAAFGQQQLAYFLVLPACQRGQPFWLHLPPLLGLALTAFAAVISWREIETAGGSDGEDEPLRTGSAWFFGVVGLILSGLAAALIFAQWLPTLFIPACQR
jgi:hypothetical protein